jgi:hypothetical protein
VNFLNIRPPRGSIRNLVNGEEQDFQFNPQTLEETVEAKYSRAQVHGLSHERMGYTNTGNLKIPIELFISTIAQDLLGQQASSQPSIRTRKAWLQSLAYPASSPDFGLSGTPRILIIWPNVLTLRGRVTKVSFLHRTFSNVDLKTTVGVAKLDFEEDRDDRILMDEVASIGSLREDINEIEVG